MIASRARNPYSFWLTYAVIRAGEATIAGFFLDKLPEWRSITWFSVIFVLGTLQFAVPYTRFYQQATRETRRTVLRLIFLPHAFWAGAVAYFFYVPDDFVCLSILNTCIVCMAALAALSTADDLPRTAGSVCLIVLPTTVRYFSEGGYTLTLFGVGGILITTALVLLARESNRTLQTQRRQRLLAERATEAVAAVNLNKARFFAAVSHDLRQPVHAIGLYTEPLMALKLGDAQMQAVNGIRQGWLALDALLSQVLDLTKLDAGAIEPKPFSLEIAHLVHNLVLQHGSSAEKKGIRLLVLVKVGRYAMVDGLMFQRVVSNLLSNAIKFSPHGGRIVIALRSRWTSHQPNGWQLEVRDQGPGIALQEQARIFEEFVQLDNPARQREHGIGLGLAIAKRFCELMECDLSVRSTPGRGTVMSMRLAHSQPIGPAAPPVVQKTTWADADLSANGHGQKVLLLEDDPLISSSMRLLLRNWGYLVRCTANAQQALNWATLDCICICDVRIPGTMSGLDVARILKRRGVRVAVMTGETDPGARAQAEDMQVDMLIKPVAPKRLHTVLAHMSDEHGTP